MIKSDLIRSLLSLLVIMIMLAVCSSQAVPLPSTKTPVFAGTSTSKLDPVLSLPKAILKTGGVQYQSPHSIAPDLQLSGQLIMAGYDLGITRFDLATGESTPIFQPVENSFVGAALLSPDAQTYLMIYSPPRDPKDPQYGASSLYTLPADGSSEPSRLLHEDDSEIHYFSPWWSPDGQSVYYGRQESPALGAAAKDPLRYFFTRYTLPNGPAQDLLADVLALRISSDGRKMFYVSGYFDSLLNDIYIADPDGSHPTSLLPSGENWIVDSIAVSPDNQTIVFSSSDSPPIQTGLSWFDRVMGVGVAQAHNVPSDLFIMKIGEPPHQLTHLADGGFIEDFSPDGQFIVFSCSSGVYVIRPDGSGLTLIMSDPVYGTIQWVS